MPRDPCTTWQHFAHAAIQEESPAKLAHLMQKLYRALDEAELLIVEGGERGGGEQVSLTP